jgi:hypothetical protein
LCRWDYRHPIHRLDRDFQWSLYKERSLTALFQGLPHAVDCMIHWKSIEKWALPMYQEFLLIACYEISLRFLSLSSLINYQE